PGNDVLPGQLAFGCARRKGASAAAAVATGPAEACRETRFRSLFCAHGTRTPCHDWRRSDIEAPERRCSNRSARTADETRRAAKTRSAQASPAAATQARDQ